jgi:transcriptional regulator with XRE-family HTH domain
MTDDKNLVDRMTRNPTLRPSEIKEAVIALNRKKCQIARILGIEPETLSRILKGRPASVPVEKLLRLLVVCEAMPDETPQELKAKWEMMQQVVSLRLTPVEIAQ